MAFVLQDEDKGRRVKFFNQIIQKGVLETPFFFDLAKHVILSPARVRDVLHEESRVTSGTRFFGHCVSSE